jgi:hypothetical protein
VLRLISCLPIYLKIALRMEWEDECREELCNRAMRTCIEDTSLRGRSLFRTFDDGEGLIGLDHNLGGLETIEVFFQEVSVELS